MPSENFSEFSNLGVPGEDGSLVVRMAQTPEPVCEMVDAFEYASPTAAPAPLEEIDLATRHSTLEEEAAKLIL